MVSSAQDGLIPYLNQLDENLESAFAALAQRSKVWDLLGTLLLVFLGITALSIGTEAEIFANADSYYPVQQQYYSLLEYRPPPSNNLFPDVLVHSLLHPWVQEPFTQKLTAGILLFGALAIIVGTFAGFAALVLVTAIYSTTGFDFFDSTAHFSLPLCMMLILIARSRIVFYLFVFIGVFSDLLLVIPLIVFYLLSDNRREPRIDVLIILVAASLNIFYSEFSEALLKLFPVLLVFAGMAYLAKRLGVMKLFGVSLCVGLPLVASLEPIPSRYAVACSASILPLLFPVSKAHIQWRVIAWPLALSGLFLASLRTGDLQALNSRFSCLAEELQERGIGAVAVDHWTAKPLYFATLKHSSHMTFTQLDFREGDIHLWMAPHSFYGSATNWAIYSEHVCTKYTTDSKYCGQFELTTVASSIPVCETFELIEYARPVPLKQHQKPDNKLGFAIYHLKNYVNKTVEAVSGFR